MLKYKRVNIILLNVFLLILAASLSSGGCGKKDGTSTGDNKTSGNNDTFSPDNPVHVVFSMSGTTNGTVDAYYNGKRVHTESKLNVAGQQMTASAYFNGGDTVYIVSDFAGVKTGMKFGKYDYAKKKDDVDFTNVKDKLKEMDKIGSEEILGKSCDIYRSKDSSYTMSVYKESVPLKFNTAKGKIVLVATKYEDNVKVSDDMFEPPKDVKFTDNSSMMKDMKDPKNMENMKEKMKEMEDVMKNYKK